MATDSSLNKIKEIATGELQFLVNKSKELLDNSVNPDKVYQWVLNVQGTYSNPPTPPSEREIQKREKIIETRKIRRAKVNILNQELKDIYSEYGISLVAVLDWKRIDNADLTLYEKLAKNKGLHILIEGDGAYLIIVSEKEPPSNLFNILNDKEEEICSLKGKCYFDPIYDVTTFKAEIIKLLS